MPAIFDNCHLAYIATEFAIEHFGLRHLTLLSISAFGMDVEPLRQFSERLFGLDSRQSHCGWNPVSLNPFC